jgi:hypothetical protein
VHLIDFNYSILSGVHLEYAVGESVNDLGVPFDRVSDQWCGLKNRIKRTLSEIGQNKSNQNIVQNIHKKVLCLVYFINN